MEVLIESQFTIGIRVLIALLLGLTVGFERQKIKTETNTHGSAGLRTHALVCIGTALITSIGVILFPGDPLRLAASIMTGIGFIGAGTIIALDGKVRGLTTASAIWAVAAIGIACGVGLYIVAVFVTLIAVIVLELRRFESVR